MFAPAIVVHDLAQAEAALSAARTLGKPVTLTSAPGAGAYLGSRTFLKIIDAAASMVPGVEFQTVIDCGGEPGLAMAALRQGARRIAIDVSGAAAERLSDMARQHGATVLASSDTALDLAACDDAEQAARNYLTETDDDA